MNNFSLIKYFYTNINRMRGKYICKYPHNSGEICGKGCTDPKGCRTHRNCPERKPCEKCGKPTSSASGKCSSHTGGYYVMEYYRKLREKVNEYEKQLSISE